MTLEKFKEWKADLINDATIKWEVNKSRYEKEYSAGFDSIYMQEKIINIGTAMWNFTTIEEFNIFHEDLQESHERFKDKPGFELSMSGNAYNNYDDSSEIDEVYAEIIFFEPMSQEKFNKKLRSEMLKNLSVKLNPKDNSYVVQIDCNAVEMFENEEITWKGLQKITYGTCKT